MRITVYDFPTYEYTDMCETTREFLEQELISSFMSDPEGIEDISYECYSTPIHSAVWDKIKYGNDSSSLLKTEAARCLIENCSVPFIFHNNCLELLEDGFVENRTDTFIHEIDYNPNHVCSHHTHKEHIIN